jgi:hypothetical protein
MKVSTSRRRVLALLGAIALVTATLVVAAPGSAVAAGCSVKHVVTAHWGSGFQAQLTITPGAAVTGWTLEYDVAAEQVVTFAAYAGFVQAGSHVTLRNASFNGNVSAGASVPILVGVHTNPTFTNVPPASFVLNGQPCSYTPQPYLAASAHRVMVPEGGSTTVTVRLSSAPPSTVTVTVAGGSQDSVITASPTALTFTPANWSVPQTLTLASIEDADTTAQTGMFSANQQNYLTGYSPVAPAVIGVTQLDNDQENPA